MLGSLTTKLALRKVGLSTSDFNFASSPSSSPSPARREPNKLRKNRPPTQEELDEEERGGSWASPSWMSLKSLPLTVQPWFAPPAPPVEVAGIPQIGDAAPIDRDRKLQFRRGRSTLVVFLRCVGCAFAQRTFLNLRTIANRYSSSLDCVAVSHSSPQATKKWIDLLGGAWNVQIVIDEDRSVYAAWGLGLGNVWYLFNPTTQKQGWKEKGWLGEKVATAIEKRPDRADQRTLSPIEDDENGDDGPLTTMGNKWQEAGSFAVDGRGTVIWGGKALRADDVMDLEEGARILGL